MADEKKEPKRKLVREIRLVRAGFGSPERRESRVRELIGDDKPLAVGETEEGTIIAVKPEAENVYPFSWQPYYGD